MAFRFRRPLILEHFSFVPRGLAISFLADFEPWFSYRDDAFPGRAVEAV